MIAGKYDYVPNEAARNLKMSKSRAEKAFHINIIVTRIGAEETDPFYNELLGMVSTELHRHLCVMSNLWYIPYFAPDKKYAKQEIYDNLEKILNQPQDKMDGLIIMGKCKKEVLDSLKNRFKGVVMIVRNHADYGVDEVLLDGNQIASTALEYLISMGHKKIGYIGDCTFDECFTGYMNTMKIHQLSINMDHIFEAPRSEDGGYAAMEQILSMSDRPTAIFCLVDAVAVGALKRLNKRKNKQYTPSIIGCDGIEEGKYIKPMLTTIESPKEDTAEDDTGSTVIRLGIQPGVAVSEVSQYTGILEDYLAKKGVELQYIEFTYGPPMVESLSAGEIDIAMLGNLPVFTGISNGTALKAIYLTLLTENGLNGIIAGPDSGIETIEDLKGKNVGVPIGSAAHLALELILNTVDLTLDDINLVNIAAADMATSLSNKEIDAAALWETNLTKALLRSGGTLIATSKSVMEDQTFAVASEDFLENNPELANYFVAGLIQVEDYILENPQESVEGIVERTGDDAEAWEYVYGFSKASGFTEDTYETARLEKDFLEQNDLIQNDYDYNSIFDQSYWDEAIKILEN